MKVLIQFKADLNPPVAGTAALMAQVKDEVGYVSKVNQLLFTYSAVSQGFTQTKEGIPTGQFGTRGEGFYTAPLPPSCARHLIASFVNLRFWETI